MKFQYQKNEQIPKLAWCAYLNRDEDIIYVECGENVECNASWFVEGAWCGDFASGNFDEDIFFLGTGAVQKNGKVCFVTPGHTLERIYIIKESNRLFFSNSLPFILERTNTMLDNQYLEYEKAFHSILNGIDSYQKKIPLYKTEKKLYALYYCNIEVGRDLKIKIREKMKHTPFLSFEEYYDSMLNDLRHLKENMQSLNRKVQYGMITTISSGYDSAACAVVAKKLGCDTAVTFNEPEKYKHDDGSKMAQKLGYTNIIQRNAESYKNSENIIEAEYIAGGELGTGIVFSAFDSEFQSKLVFIGEGGDHIWEKNAEDVNDVVRFKDELYSGSTLIEPRLRLGYIYLPLPMYCATCWPSIFEISNSDHMQKWSVGNSYDRPIPRRIVEEAGIDREAFGFGKKGAGFNYRYDTMSRLKRRMAPSSFKEFSDFYGENSRYSPRRIAKAVTYLLNTIPDYLNFMVRKLGVKIGSKISHKKYQENPFAPAYLFLWSVELMKKRYSNGYRTQDGKD